jgi:hypothetical protein
MQTAYFQAIRRIGLMIMVLFISACSSGGGASDGVKEGTAIATVNEEKVGVK